MDYQYQIPQPGYEQLRYAPQMPLAQTATPPQGVPNTFLPNGMMAPNNSFGVTPPNPQYTMQSKRQFGNIDYNHIMQSQMLQGFGAYLRQNNQAADFKKYNQVQNNPLLQIPNNPNTSEQSLYGMDKFKKGGKKMAEGGLANFDDFDEEDFQDLKDQMDKYFSEKGQPAPEVQQDEKDPDEVADKQDADQDQPLSHDALNLINNIQQQQFEPDSNEDDQQPAQYIQAPSLSATVSGSSMPDMSDHPLLQQFKNGIAKVENAGYQEGNKHSSAFGKYQFTNGTLEAVREMQFKDIPKKDFQEAYKSDPKFQERVMDAYGTHLLTKFQDPQKAATAFFLGEGKANFYNQPDYRPTPNNLTVGSYLKNFNQGYKQRQGGHIMNRPGSIDLPINPGMKMEDGGEGPGPKKPTTADSLALYNNAKQIESYYGGNNSYKKVAVIPEQGNFDMTNDFSYKDIVARYKRNQKTSTETGDRLVKPEEFRKDVNENTYYQRESASSILDTKAPMTLFDKRISPQFISDYKNISNDSNLSGDLISLFKYDPIAVKPWNMLTPEERQQRIQKYGDPTKNSVINKSSNPPPPAKRSQVQGVQPTQYMPNIIGGQMNAQAPINPQSNFSFTGRDDNGQQATRYFSDLDNWTNATDQMGYRQRETTNNGKEAHATGYQFKEGGEYELTNDQIKQLRKQGYKIDLIK